MVRARVLRSTLWQDSTISVCNIVPLVWLVAWLIS